MPDTDIINSIGIKLTADTSKATAAIDKIISKLEKLQNVTSKGFEFKGSNSLDKFTKSLEKLSNIGELKIPKTISERITEIGNAVKGLDGVDFKQLDRLANALAKLSSIGKIKMPGISTSGARAKTQNVAQAATQAAASNPELEGTTEATSRTGEAIAEAGNESEEAANKNDLFSESLRRIGDKAKEVASKLSSTFISALKKGSAWLGKMSMTIGLMPFRKLASSVTDTTKRFTGFLAALKRIALYRAIRTILKDITAGLKEGMQNLYYYSKAINGEFAKSMDMLATSALYAKNSLGAMVAPIINQLAPAVDYLTDRFVELLNKINETIASLTGASTWTRAIKYPVEYAEATDEATKSAKKLRATLLGFDEINRLDDNSDSGSGSSASGLDYSKMFQEMDVDTSTKGWIEKVKQAWRDADFTEIGTYVGENLKNALQKIPWDEIQGLASKISQSVGTFINGFIETDDLAETIGGNIAEAINTAVITIDTFFSTVHWDSLGKFFGNGINGFKDKFDIKRLGRTIAKVINSAVTTLHNFIKTVDWNALGKFFSDGINSFFTEINIKELGQTISDGILAAIDLVSGFFEQTDFEQIGSTIGGFIKSIKWTEILDGLGYLLYLAIKAAFNTLKGLIKSNPLFGIGVAVLIAGKIAAAVLGVSVKTIVANGLKGLFSSSITSASTSASVGNAASVAGKAIGGAIGVAAASYFGFKFGNYLYENVPAIQKAADGLMETLFGGTGVVSDSARAKKRKIAYAFNHAGMSASEMKQHLGYASGGTPETGQLFLAREAGPELVASVGAHKTQVANNDQIMSSIQAGVEVANEESNALLREQNELLRRLLGKETTVVANITTDSIISGLDRKNRRDGRTVVPVGV